jgi:hypothetical protein
LKLRKKEILTFSRILFHTHIKTSVERKAKMKKIKYYMEEKTEKKHQSKTAYKFIDLTFHFCLLAVLKKR